VGTLLADMLRLVALEPEDMRLVDNLEVDMRSLVADTLEDMHLAFVDTLLDPEDMLLGVDILLADMRSLVVDTLEDTPLVAFVGLLVVAYLFVAVRPVVVHLVAFVLLE
jgi:hypothetical protein